MLSIQNQNVILESVSSCSIPCIIYYLYLPVYLVLLFLKCHFIKLPVKIQYSFNRIFYLYYIVSVFFKGTVILDSFCAFQKVCKRAHLKVCYITCLLAKVHFQAQL